MKGYQNKAELAQKYNELARGTPAHKKNRKKTV